MCGIAGYIGKRQLEDARIVSSLETMKRRGPDAQRHVRHTSGDLFVDLLHSRLSIIDLDPRSHQPFSIGHCHMVFNGEIYNYLELRKSLLDEGISLHTSSDTEVLLHLYLKHGEKCVDLFEGMWAFVIYDERKNHLFLSRDRFAEKPLYYFQNSDGFYFASETNTLRVLSGVQFKINEQHLLRYIINGHKSLYKTNDTWYEGVSELPVASNAIVDERGIRDIASYWVPRYVPKENMTLEEATEGTRERLIESMKLRLRSDVPLAFCLSGGVDSASLVSIASKVFNANVNTFSIIDTDHRYDELDNIVATIEDTGCASTKIVLKPEERHKERLEDLIAYHDAPIATISYLVHSMLSESIGGHGYKISISGTGADEMFTGYYDHFIMQFAEIRHLPEFDQRVNEWRDHVLGFVRHPDFRKFDLFFDNPSTRDHIYLNNDEFRSYLVRDWSEAFTEIHYSSSLLRNRMMNEMFHEVVRVILHEDDLNSMRYSIENRSPFLDKPLFEFAYTIPPELLIREGYNKFILRNAMRGILNDQVRLSREKKGFNASINSIFDFNNPQDLSYFLDDSSIFKWFDKSKIEKTLKQKEFSNSYKKFLFNFICAKIFLDKAGMR